MKIGRAPSRMNPAPIMPNPMMSDSRRLSTSATTPVWTSKKNTDAPKTMLTRIS